MGLLGPTLNDLLFAAEGAVGAVIGEQIGHDPTPAEWAMTIGKKREDGGLGFTELRAWVLLVKEVVEGRLYTLPKYGSRFHVIRVDEPYSVELQKASLNIMAMDLAVTAMRGKARPGALIT